MEVENRSLHDVFPWNQGSFSTEPWLWEKGYSWTSAQKLFTFWYGEALNEFCLEFFF